MDAGTVPPHWEDLLEHSSKKATDEEFSLAKDWMDAMEKMPDQLNDTAGSGITDPFVVVTESSPANATREATASQDQPTKAPALSAPSSSDGMHANKGGKMCTSATSLPVSNAAASSAQKQQRFTPTDDVATNSRREFGSTEDADAHARNQ
jgi:hypothetical protein